MYKVMRNRDMAIVTMEREYEIVCDIFIGTVSNDLE